MVGMANAGRLWQARSPIADKAASHNVVVLRDLSGSPSSLRLTATALSLPFPQGFEPRFVDRLEQILENTLFPRQNVDLSDHPGDYDQVLFRFS